MDTNVYPQQYHMKHKGPQFYSGKVIQQEKKALTSNKPSHVTMATLSSLKSRQKMSSLDHASAASASFETIEDDFEWEKLELPQNESIPQHIWTMASAWIQVVGRDIVACLLSKDWQVLKKN
jgi:hypothetical protein